jgi:1,2-diacylglycerol 3-beta-glucosyltransferase
MAIVAVYLAGLLVAAAGLARAPRSRRRDGDLPTVTVVLACRNEERDLPRCLRAFARLDYPPELLDFVLVDDGSTDGTRALLERSGLPRARVLSTDDAGLTSLRAKARGLAWGARHAAGAWLFVTDADAIVPPGWIRHALSDASDDVGIVGGPALPEPTSFTGVLERAIASLLVGFGFAPAGLGGRSVVAGSNVAIRRTLYESMNGLEGRDFVVAEDMALLSMAIESGLRVVAYVDPHTTVSVAPVPSLLALFSQQRRWFLGGRDADTATYAPVVLAVGGAAALDAALVHLGARSPSMGLLAIGALFAGSTMMLGVFGARVGEKRLALYGPLATTYFLLVAPLVIVTAIVWPRIAWRGEGFVVHFGSSRDRTR